MEKSRILSALALPAIVSCFLTSGAVAEPVPAAKEDKLVVFAASSLQDAFTQIGEAFKRARPGITVTFNFAGTQELRTQLQHGASADVFASADVKHMDELVQASRVEKPVVFARNEPVIVVASESIGKVRGIGDLPSVDRIVLGVPEVPIGRYAEQILERASATSLGPDFRSRVDAKVVSRELNVRQVLAKVTLGEADAAIVYRTDVRGAGAKVGVVPISLDLNVIAEYPIAVVSDAAHPELARAWVAFVLTLGGQHLLRQAGFIGPPTGAARE